MPKWHELRHKLAVLIFTVMIGDSDRSKKLWFAGRWENTRGQKGPFGEIQSESFHRLNINIINLYTK
jgi:hypothetical protein